jgi:hypothetical protein
MASGLPSALQASAARSMLPEVTDGGGPTVKFPGHRWE